ncbi:hypothetical protein RN001_014339 [Aquatica leii]|uniref:Uncharacterized protein n=1 Tax=Aquatica leii TaxID=1421715 RepID=A0AAN7SEI1_9COLE|nr:hypothetical protein RN001_014339 [Aquatica leii]
MREEFRILKEKWEEKANIWKEEKTHLENRITKPEENLERQEKENKKLNIVIKGLDDANKEHKKGVQKLIEEKLEIQTKIEQVFTVGKDKNKQAVIVKMHNWEAKKEIMEQKKRLSIENHLTLKQKPTQIRLKEMADKLKKDDKRVKIEYKKLIINNLNMSDYVRIWKDIKTGSEPDRSRSEENHLNVEEDDFATEQAISENEAPIQQNKEPENPTKKASIMFS